MPGIYGLRKAAIAVGVLGLIAAGCGSSSKSASSTTNTTTGVATTTSTSSAASTTGSAASSGSSGSVQGITATTITLGQLADVSGPVPGLFTGAANGMDAWAAYVNSTGGIDGRKIVIDHKDSGLDCGTYTNGFESLASSVFANVGTYSLVDACGQKTLVAKPSFPDIEAVVLNPAIAIYPNVYGAIPASNGYYTAGYQWVKDKYGLAAVQHTADLYVQSSEFDFTIQKAAAESVGYDYVYARGYGNTETNYTSDILRMKSDGVKVVDLIDMSVPDLAGFLQQAAQQSFHPDAVINTDGYDPTLFKLTGNAANAAPLVFPLTYSMYLGEDAASVPEITTMTSWLQKTHPGYPMNLFVMEAYSAGLLFQQAMATLGSNPTSSQLLGAISKITNFTANGLLSTANVGQKKGQTCVVIVRPVNGKFARIDPTGSGFECNGTFIYAKASS